MSDSKNRGGRERPPYEPPELSDLSGGGGYIGTMKPGGKSPAGQNCQSGRGAGGKCQNGAGASGGECKSGSQPAGKCKGGSGPSKK